jgi:hypothetical protein
MQRRGEIAAGVDTARAAAAIIAGIQGGVAILMATGSVEHLVAALDTALDDLRGSAPAATAAGPSLSRPTARRWPAGTAGPAGPPG